MKIKDLTWIVICAAIAFGIAYPKYEFIHTDKQIYRGNKITGEIKALIPWSGGVWGSP